MSVLTIPRVFGGTLIIVVGPSTASTAITATGRDGKVSSIGRDGKVAAAGRDGKVTGKGR